TRPRTVMSCNECRTKKRHFSGLNLSSRPNRSLVRWLGACVFFFALRALELGSVEFGRFAALGLWEFAAGRHLPWAALRRIRNARPTALGVFQSLDRILRSEPGRSGRLGDFDLTQRDARADSHRPTQLLSAPRCS